MLIIIISFLTIALIIAYMASNGDFMAPPVLMTGMFWVSYLCVVYMQPTWNIEFKFDTLVCLAVGIGSFFIGYYLLALGVRGKHSVERLRYIRISNMKIIIFYIVSVIVMMMFLRYVKSAVGGNNWLDTMARYRFTTAYGNTTGEFTSIPSGIATLKMFLNVSPYLFSYVLVNNYLAIHKWDIRLIIAIIIGVISSLIGGSRFDLIRVPIAIIVTYYLLSLRSFKIDQKTKIKFFLRALLIVIVVVVLFSTLRSFVGRKNTSDFTTYISQYLGAPNALLNEFLKNPIHTEFFGKETFWGIYNGFGRVFHNSKYIYDYTLEFKTINGNSLGNVYTAFRMYYADFGYPGVAILDFLLGLIFAIIYFTSRGAITLKNIVRIRINKFHGVKIYASIIIYAMIIHSIVLMFYADWFYSQVLSWTQIKGFIFLWILKVIFVDFDRNNRVKDNEF